VLRTGEAVDLIRESVRTVLQELIEAEAAEFIGATRYERSESRTNERNGSRPRMLATKAGDIDLRIPKLRKGSFFPLILDPRRRIDRALYAVVMEAYVAGVSTRSVDDLVAALGIDSGISKSEVSRICAGLDEVVTAFRTRRLDHTGFPYVYLDATYLHVRNSTSQVVSMAVVVATGITTDGGREVLGLDLGDSEDEVFWRGFLTALNAVASRGCGWSSPTSTPVSWLPPNAASSAPGTKDAGCTSPGICWHTCPRRTPTWSPPCSAPSSFNPTRPPSRRAGTRSVASSPAGSRRSAP